MSGYAILQEYMFTDKDKHEWTDAMCYLLEKYDEFPSDMDVNIQYEPEHKDFRFIKSPDGKILFGNCMVPAITADDFYQFKSIN